MKAIKFKEKDLYSIELPRGLYIVDGSPIDVEGYSGTKIQVKDVNNIVPILRRNIIDHYESDVLTLTTEAYRVQRDILLKERREDGYDEVWTSLKAEFNYRRFLQKWIKIERSVETKGDPFTVEIVESQVNTGNEFISSEYINGGKDPLLFSYSRSNALISMVRNKFSELGMTYQDGISYGNTNGKKVWGNGTNSGIKYVTAFNKYIFNDEWSNVGTQRGDMDKLIESYDADKKAIETIIQTKYNVHFGVIDSGNFDFEKLIVLLNTCKNHLNSVESKAKTSNSLMWGKGKLRESINFIESNYKEVKDER